MNLYLRYFDNETLVTSVDDAIEFLRSIDEIGMDASLEADIREYAASSVLFPKRYKIRSRVYFIIIKTLAATMQEFKEHRNRKKEDAPKDASAGSKDQSVSAVMLKLNESHPGWYEGTLLFKRVNLEPGSGKFRYLDTSFVANVKADSAMDCYNRMVAHLQERVDPRSQFPSPKGKNFSYRFLGAAK